MKLKNFYIFVMLTLGYLLLNAQTPFVTKWDTNANNDGSKQLNIGLRGDYLYYYVSETDNNIEGSGIGTGNLVLDLPETDKYLVFIIPNSQLGFKAEVNSQLDANKLLDVIQWGSSTWESNLSEMFKNCKNITTFSAFDVPDFSNVTNMSSMFNGAENFNGNISSWDTSNVTNMYAMFAYAKKFNQPIGNWDLSNVTTTNAMFYNAINFNQPIENWNTANITNMSSMFNGASSFNQPIGNWNTINVADMSGMFNGASSFNQSIEGWNVSNVTHMSNILQNASSFNQSLGNWNLNKISSGVYGLLYGLSGTNINCINYTKTLKGWAENSNTASGVLFLPSGIKYGSDALLYRNILINNKGWNISEDIFDSSCSSSLNVENLNSKIELKIFPNPANDLVNIQSNKDIKSILIYSTDGKLLSEVKNQKTFNLSKYPIGNYLVKVIFVSGEELTKKLIKK